MNKNDLVKEISQMLNLPQKEVLKSIDAITTIISKSLSKGEKVSLRDFGSFEILKRNARNGINPKSGDKIKIPSKQVVKFNVSKQLKEMVKN